MVESKGYNFKVENMACGNNYILTDGDITIDVFIGFNNAYEYVDRYISKTGYSCLDVSYNPNRPLSDDELQQVKYETKSLLGL